MPTLAPVLTRLPAALAVALLTALVFGALVGVASASNGSTGDAKHLAIPLPSVGDQWSYQAVLQGPWTFGDNDPQAVGVPFTYAEYSWLSPRLIRDGDGAEVAVDHLESTLLFHLPIPPQAADYTGGHLWLTEHRGYDYEVGSGHGVSEDYPDKSQEGTGGSGSSSVAGMDVAANQVRVVAGESRSFGGAVDSCLSRAAYQGHTIDLGEPLPDVGASEARFGCLPLMLDGFTDFTNESAWEQMFEPGGPLTAHGRDVVAGHSAVRFDGDGVRLWLSADLPVPLQIEGWSGDQKATVTLSSWHAGKEALGAGPLTHPGLAPPIVLAPRQLWGPDDSGVDVPFPASTAFKAALASPTFPDLRDWLAAHPRGTTFWLEFREDLTSLPAQRMWLFSLTDGSETTTVQATQQFFMQAPAIPPTTSFQTLGFLSPLVHLFKPSLDGIPEELPTVKSTLARWQAYEATEGNETTANGWGMISYCMLFCGYNTTRVVAGTDPVAFLRVETNSATAVHPPLGNVTFSGSQLDAGADGSTQKVVHWTGYARSGPDLTPLTAYSPVDPAPKHDPGRGPIALGSFVPTAGQAGAVSLFATLVGLLYYVWPSLKGGSFLGLFSRLQGPQLLVHPSRARLMEVIQSEPGIHFQDLVRRSGLPNGTAVHHARKLEQAGLIAVRPLGRYTCYFPGTPERAALAAAPVTRSDGARRILAELVASPGLSGSELAVRLGLQPSTVAYHVKRLEQVGLLSSVREGRSVRLRATASA